MSAIIHSVIAFLRAWFTSPTAGVHGPVLRQRGLRQPGLRLLPSGPPRSIDHRPPPPPRGKLDVDRVLRVHQGGNR